MGASHCRERMGAGEAFPSSEEAETHPMHRDDTTNEWGASPLNGRKGGKWARPTCQDGVERAQSPFSSLARLVRLVEVGDEKVGQQKEQGHRHGHDQNNREPGSPASPGGAIHCLLHE